MVTPELWKVIHGNVDFESLVPTNIENLYSTGNMLSPYLYIDGLFTMELSLPQTALLGVEDSLPTPEAKRNLNEMNEALGFTSDMMLEAITLQKSKSDAREKVGDYETIFQLISKKVGLSMFVRHYEAIDPLVRFDAFRAIYTRSEAGFEILKPLIPSLIEDSKLSDTAQVNLDTLASRFGERFMIYHGNEGPGDLGMSWTTNKDVAQWFAKRFGREGEVIEKEIEISEAIEYILDRDEEEVLYVAHCNN